MKIRDRIKELRRVRAGDLVPNSSNWREHPKAQQDAMRAILAEVGYADALLAYETPEGLKLVDGHLRAEITPDVEVPVLVLDINEEEAAKILLTHDPIAAMATANQDALAKLLENVGTKSEALTAMLEGLAKENGIEPEPEAPVDAEPQIDRAAELQKEWGTATGQLWIIKGKAGEHRVLCGDSTKREDVERVMGGVAIVAIVSDPPYGMNYTGTAGTAQAGMDNSQRRAVRPVVGDDREFDPSFILGLCPSGDVLLWGADWYYSRLPPGGSWIVWDKRASEAADATPGAPFEVCWSRRRQERKMIRIPWGGWINKEANEAERWHPTQKPVGVMAATVSATKGDLILDPYLGSGTTLIAAETLNRRCFGIEISAAYTAVILQRAKDCGLTPRLEAP